MTNPIEHFDFNGLAAIRLTAPDGAQAVVLKHGAQIVSWIPAGGEERLYLSDRSKFDAGSAIRGGVPVCFPQFSSRGPLPKHGFARTLEWELSEARGGNDFAVATLELFDDEQTRQIWPHSFEAELTVLVTGQRLDIEFDVRNPGNAPFSFTCALHTYLRTREVEESRLEGLRGLAYFDAVKAVERKETGTEIVIEDETDRIYFNAARPLLLREPHRSLGISSENLPDVVVWNPWEHLTAKLPDMPTKGFRHMLCVEAAAIGSPIELMPNSEWWGRQTLVAL
ncbi:MAG: D-hexose-6-phosphate mutarotase [Betaproteobacteria bacterium]|nr:D-hexose-6-phosphate mutarotase [Betaproteobacteria bacterium]